MSKVPPAPTARKNPRLLTLEEAAKLLGTTERFARRLIEERRIDYVKLGSGKRSPVRIPEVALEAFIAQSTVEATG